MSEKGEFVVQTNGRILIALMEKMGLMEYSIKDLGLPFISINSDIRGKQLAFFRTAVLTKVNIKEKKLFDKKSLLMLTGEWDDLTEEEREKYELTPLHWEMMVESEVCFYASIIDGLAVGWQMMYMRGEGRTIPPSMYNELLQHEKAVKDHLVTYGDPREMQGVVGR